MDVRELPTCFCELSLLSNVSGVVASLGAQSDPLSAALIVTGECATGVYNSQWWATQGVREDSVRIVSGGYCVCMCGCVYGCMYVCMCVMGCVCCACACVCVCVFSCLL